MKPCSKMCHGCPTAGCHPVSLPDAAVPGQVMSYLFLLLVAVIRHLIQDRQEN